LEWGRWRKCQWGQHQQLEWKFHCRESEMCVYRNVLKGGPLSKKD
jgi:hypothetical protein